MLVTISHLEALVVILSMFILRTSVSLSYDEPGLFEEDYETPSFSNARCPWIRYKLKNGRVKIRSRGRIAKFVCEPGYDLAGKRFATCVRGQWNNPIPVCVTRGCHKPPDVKNSRITKLYRGAVINYDCQPGYTLDGGATIYCDGRRWSSQAPICMVATSDPSTTCDFEDPDSCGWSQDPTHDFDWKRNQLFTPSGHVGTGPSFDHTFGPGKAGFYMYLEASSPRKQGDKARLFSPVFPADYSGGCFTFWYHMYGETTGGLELYVKPENQVFGEQELAWKTIGDQGNRWYRGEIAIPNITENFQIIIEGTRGSNYLGDSAIDDINLAPVDCQSVRNLTNNASDLLSYSCRGRCREVVNSSFCGCGDECVTDRSCCDDFSTICTKSIDSEGDTADENVSITAKPHITTFMTSSLLTDEDNIRLTTTDDSTNDNEYIGGITEELKTGTDSHTTEIIQSSTHSPSTSKPTTKFTPLATTRTSVSSTKNTQPTTMVYSQSTISTIAKTTHAALTETLSTSLSTITYKITPTQLQTTSLAPIVSTATEITAHTGTKTSSNSPFTSVASSTLKPSSTTLPPTIPYVIDAKTTKRYNLRPRNRTTTVISEFSTKTKNSIVSDKSTVSYFSTPFTSEKPQIESTTTPTTPSTTSSTSNSHREVLHFDISQAFTSPTVKPREVSTVYRTSHKQPLFTKDPQIRTSQWASTTKQITVTTPTSLTSDYFSHASKTSHVASSKSSAVTIATTITILAICCTVGIGLYIRKQRLAKQSKLADDSEMRFLSENEVVEFNDPSALDRVGYSY